MTIEEFNELDEYSKEYYSEWRDRTLEIWAEQQYVKELPYPENFFRYVYGFETIFKKSLDDDYVLQLLRGMTRAVSFDAIKALFADKRDLQEYADSVGLMPQTVTSHVAGAARRFRHPCGRNKLRGYIELVRKDGANGEERKSANAEECKSENAQNSVSANAEDSSAAEQSCQTEAAEKAQNDDDIAEEFLSVRNMLRGMRRRHGRLGL